MYDDGWREKYPKNWGSIHEWYARNQCVIMQVHVLLPILLLVNSSQKDAIT